jgi:hypothetical protein
MEIATRRQVSRTPPSVVRSCEATHAKIWIAAAIKRVMIRPVLREVWASARGSLSDVARGEGRSTDVTGLVSPGP